MDSGSSMCSDASFPQPPVMLAQEFELDCSRFDHAPALPSFASSAYSSVSSSQSSYNSLSSAGRASGLTRSRCVQNLSALGGSAYSESLSRRAPTAASAGPNAGWGYFADAVER